MGRTANIPDPYTSQSSFLGRNPKEVMSCENCGRKFTIFRIKKRCTECHRYYCGNCLQRVGGLAKKACCICQIFMSKPLQRSQLMELKVKDLQWYLKSKDISMRACVEKEDLVSLILQRENRSNRQQPSERGRRHSFDGSDTNSPTDQTGSRNFRPDRTARTEDPLFRSSDNVIPNRVPSSRERRNESSRHNDTSDHSEPFVVINPANLDEEFLMNVNEESEPQSPSERLQNPSGPPESGVWNSSPPSSPPQPPTGSSLRNRSTPAASQSPMRTSSPTTPHSPEGISPNVPQLMSGSTFWNPSPPSPPQPSSFWDNSPPTPPQPPFFRSDSPSELPSANHSSPSGHQRSSTPVELTNIKKECDLDGLTVKQLKSLLANNRVDYRGCCEKSELLEKTRMLWKAEMENKKDLENIPDDNLCKICMNNVIDCVMLECGHMATCIKCGKQMNECPICRRYVVRVVRIFRA